ncbi:protein of unknown function DUF1790 (plasmid) [Oscillatoria nigro-viridis PCC 7112]|uniref:YbjN domain-containing protein n=1 Tax=Phormidium nigroviride PCC 7112 TaxID=179408 RepID=K9VTS7_9CYAN|nr:YbjN domain-containing protein [Oscillatoria nigro-viridis]AFZ10969.1 protein of unknown function DUF1790 [Oscillatoria nigro-viridis PCC 7112]
MTTQTETYQLDTEFTLRDSSQSPLTIHALTLSITTQDRRPIESRLTFQVTPETYQRIDTESLFNLKPELRCSLTGTEFTSDSPIEIIACLKPELITPIADIPTYLKTLSEQQDNSLLFTKNWLALQVKQRETSYRTFWDYLNLEAMTVGNINNEKVNDAIVSFFKDCAEANLLSMNGETISQALLEVTKEFEEWVDANFSNINEESIAGTIESIGKSFEELAASSSSETERDILSALIEFFASDDWPFVKIDGEPVLRALFAGKNGKWTCYAKARTEKTQFVFYSICPVSVPESKRLAIAEFITRANYGTIIGNFELDFATGEIRYKTSIDISGSTLASTQIKQLVYANVMMMDEYLPGILSVIDGDVEVKDAIASIESPPTTQSDGAPARNESPLENPPSPDARSQPVEIKNTPPSTVILPDEPKPNLNNNSFPPLPQAATPVNNIEQLPTNSPSEKPKPIGEILSLLTLEEIADFDRVRVMLHTKQPFAAKTLMTKLEKQLTARLNADGSTIFADSKNFFDQNKTPLKTANLIRRYWNLFERSTQLIEGGENNAPSIRQAITPTLLVVEKLAHRIEARIAQIVASYVDAKLEIECLIEIEQLTEQLTYCLEQLKNST